LGRKSFLELYVRRFPVLLQALQLACKFPCQKLQPGAVLFCRFELLYLL
jgi:hypothetical protein